MTEYLRVWWSSCVPITEGSKEQYPVKNIQEARRKIIELTVRDAQNKLVTDNVGGLEAIYEHGDPWNEWYCNDCGCDIMECTCKPSPSKQKKASEGVNECLSCGKETKNKQFCSGECRKNFNMVYKENDFRAPPRSFRGLRA